MSMYAALYKITKRLQHVGADHEAGGAADFWRAQAVMAVLHGCGQSFVRSSHRPKLDRFMLVFQRYILAQEEPPADFAFSFKELFSKLQPRKTRCTSHFARLDSA